jgi:predicted metal-dependent hydrolase
VDRGRDAPPRSGGVSMTSASARFARGLRRFVDSLQRGLFDGPEPSTAPARVPSAAPTGPSTSPTPEPASQPLREAVLDGQRIAFRLVRVRRRSIGFVVDERGLTVRAPHRISLREIDDAVGEKRRWILVRLAEQRERAERAAATRTVWRDGATIDYLGRPLTIVLDAGAALAAGETALLAAPAAGIAVGNAAGDAVGAAAGAAAPDATASPRLLVALPRDADQARVRDAVQSWLQREARRVFAERVAHFSTQLGVRVSRLSLSSAATRWGSASGDGSIRLHWRLVQHAPETIDYVVAHELAHLREMNHSPRFWSVVRSVVPDYEAARERLRDAGRHEP